VIAAAEKHAHGFDVRVTSMMNCIADLEKVVIEAKDFDSPVEPLSRLTKVICS
jgi:hypothetical protein